MDASTPTARIFDSYAGRCRASIVMADGLSRLYQQGGGFASAC